MKKISPSRVATASIILLLILSRMGLAQSDEYIVRSTASPCLNVRSDPNSDADPIACLTPATKVNVTATVPFWREITFGNGQTGWVAKKFIEPAATVIPVDPNNIIIPDDAMLTVHFIDVGQGDAIWIQTYDDGIDGNGVFEGYSIIIDGGPYSSDSNNPLRTYIEGKGYHGAPVEALILTHPHDDHYSGAEMISRHFSINHYYDPGYPSSSSAYLAFLNSIKGTGSQAPRAKKIHIGKQNFDQMNWGSELKVEVLHSWNGDPGNTLGSGNTEVNNSSIVLRVQYGDHVFLFMGDAEGKNRPDNAATPKYVEDVLLQTQPTKLKSTVLKIAHHGSETSSTLPFIQAVDPDVVVVQSGRKSFSGTYLPDATTLKRYCAHNPNVRIYRNDQGDEELGYAPRQAVDNDHVIIRTNGKGQPMVEAFDGGVLYTGNFCSDIITLNSSSLIKKSETDKRPQLSH